MEKNTIYVSSSIIQGLNSKPRYFDEKCFWTWSLYFVEGPLTVPDLPFIYVGKTEEEAQEAVKRIKAEFTHNGIFDNERVGIIRDNSGIIAIGKNGSDIWFDLKDGFKAKSFKQLSLSIDSLAVWA